MKELVAQLLDHAIRTLIEEGVLDRGIKNTIQVERTKDKTHGDFASNLALVLAKQARSNPRELAQKIVAALPASSSVKRTEIAGPGFINFFLNESSIHQVVSDILSLGNDFGKSRQGAGQKIQLEFVSANPTGPLHVGHGRGAAYGATYANLLEAIGYCVDREYYVNDAGRQMDILATSVWLRYLELCGETLAFPSNGYKGDYIVDYAKTLFAASGSQFRHDTQAVFAHIAADEPEGGDKEQHIDALIQRCKTLLGEHNYELVFQTGLKGILNDIKEDLAEFGVSYQHWFSERSLTTPENLVNRAVKKLEDAGYIEERDGALWFLSTRFGDDKDRVVIRENGQATYFASDIAYHLNKFERGYDQIINIWGADHHGYIARVKAALTAMGLDAEKLTIRLVQFVSLYRGNEQVQMSTRSGSFITLRELRNEVGDDAARFFYITRRCEQPMDFDLELATSQSKDNPVYYIQYAHARICSVARKAAEQNTPWNREQGLAAMSTLKEESEIRLMSLLASYPEVLLNAGLQGEPHLLTNYLRDLASEFHTWYNAHKTLVEDADLRNARLSLSIAVKQVLYNALHLLGVSAPESM
ncbi:MAG: arginine--tRNA ligase [Pseudomonadales bacterium]|nr:arginine--tRNA ligase [Pseudomonadales bacterium]